MSKIKSNCTYEDTLSIYSKLPASDKRWFHNSFTNSPTTVFRWIEYYNGDKVGFIELDDYEKNGNLNISIAILPAYRNKGLLHKLIAKAEEYTNSTKSYNRLVWCSLFGNTRSAEAAKHMGFTFFKKGAQDMIYIKDLPLKKGSINESFLDMEFYHASVESYHGKLVPKAPCFGTKLYDPHWAIYFWNDKEKARWYATTQILRDYINKNIDTDQKLKEYSSWDKLLIFDYDNNKTILSEKIYNHFKEKLINKTVYIYTVKVPPNKLHNIRLGHSAYFNEYTYKEPIPIFHKEVIIMTENLFEKYHKISSEEKIFKFNTTKKFNRGIESKIFLSPIEFKVRKIKFKNLKYANKTEDGKGELSDVIQNKNKLPMIKSDKDIYCNFSKFPKENNILFVSGMSGSGKSTLTKKLAKKYNAIQISLDFLHYFPCRIIHDSNRSLEDLSKKNQYKEDRRSFEYIMKFFNSNNGKKLLNIYKKCKTNDDVNDRKVLDKLFEALFEFIEKNNIKDPIIIEGTQLTEIPDKYLDYPFIFKSVSFSETMYRRFKREDLNRFVAFIPQYNKWRKDQNVLRDKVITRTNDIRYSDNEEPI